MEEFKAKSHAVKKMTRKGLVETDSREGIVKETAEAKSDGRRINEADFQLERKGAQSRADPVDDKPVSDAASRKKSRWYSANVKHFFTLLGKMFFTSYGKEFFIYHGKQIFTSFVICSIQMPIKSARETSSTTAQQPDFGKVLKLD